MILLKYFNIYKKKNYLKKKNDPSSWVSSIYVLQYQFKKNLSLGHLKNNPMHVFSYVIASLV